MIKCPYCKKIFKKQHYLNLHIDYCLKNKSLKFSKVDSKKLQQKCEKIIAIKQEEINYMLLLDKYFEYINPDYIFVIADLHRLPIFIAKMRQYDVSKTEDLEEVLITLYKTLKL